MSDVYTYSNAVEPESTFELDRAALAARDLLSSIPREDVERDGLEETPMRFAKAFAQYTSGYDQDPASLLKSFESDGYDELVIVRRIPFYSLCEHHLAPFFGEATVSYLPSGRVVGLSKLARLVECFARRLQVQERLTKQVAGALADSGLNPRGVGVVVSARHLCMEARGIQKPGTSTVTSSMLGEFRSNQALRSEFLSLSKAHGGD